MLRSWRPDQAEVYRTSLRERLPVLRLPLRETDRAGLLDLPALIEPRDANGGYDTDLDDRVEPQPPLEGEDAVWADALLRAKGLR
jgi:hypothetical protein